MRVLVTGMTLPQTGDTGRMRIKYKSNPECLVEAMREAGHEVDFRPFAPGESVDSYDCAIVGLANALSFGAKYRLGSFYLAGLDDLPKAFLVDDWNYKGMWHSVWGLRNNPKQLFREELPTKWIDQGREHQIALLEGLYRLLSKPIEPLIGNFCDWGDLEKFREGTNIGELWGFDASIAQPAHVPSTRGGVYGCEKKFTWVLATLTNQAKWLNGLGLRWPVDVYGGSEVDKSKRKYLDDEPLFRRMEEVWGVLSPPYYHAGSGWQRPRYKYAADAGCVLLSDPSEVGAIGPSYVEAWRDREKLEQQTSAMWMHELAAAQREEYYGWMWSRDKLVQWALELPQRVVDFER